MFTTRGGVTYVDREATPWRRKRWGTRGWSATWPFALLRIDAHAVDVSSMFGEVHVTRDNLVAISRFRRIPVLSDGFKFVIDDRDEAVVFWALNPSSVLRELLEHDWQVRSGA